MKMGSGIASHGTGVPIVFCVAASFSDVVKNFIPRGWVYIMPVIDTCSRRRVEANRLRRKIVVRSRGKITLMISMTIMRGRAGKVPRPAKTRLPYGFEKARRKRRIKRAAEYGGTQELAGAMA
jgi:hypothetical protein